MIHILQTIGTFFFFFFSVVGLAVVVWKYAEWLRKNFREIKDRDGNRTYLSRWHLIGGKRNPWGSLMLHKMHRPDSDSCHHDHPWAFITLILWGGYVEQVTQEDGAITERFNRPGMILYRPAEHTHRIHELPSGNSWTLVLRFRKAQSWGFWTPEGKIPWRRFLAMRNVIPWCEGWDRTEDA